jgi:diacylglycerol kinase family enzyme
LFGNPTAQSGKNAERIARAKELLEASGLTVRVVPTEPERRTIDVVRSSVEEPDVRVVIAMGGDGTFREVAAGLYRSQARDRVALGMLPTGTANDQGKSFGLDASPSALARNVEVIVRGFETRLDTGLIRSPADGPADQFFDSAGWGLSARVLARRNRDRKLVEKLGPLKELYRDYAVYAGALLATFLESYVVPDKFRVWAKLDGEEQLFEGLSDLLVKNTRIYAGAWVFDRTSRHDDGAFELVPFRGKRDWTSKAIVDMKGNPLHEEVLNQVGIEHSHASRASVMELEIEPPEGGAPLAAQVDGEEWTASTKVKIEVDPRALRLIVPET